MAPARDLNGRPTLSASRAEQAETENRSPRMSGDLLVMAALIGISRAVLGEKKTLPQRAADVLQGGATQDQIGRASCRERV